MKAHKHKFKETTDKYTKSNAVSLKQQFLKALDNVHNDKIKWVWQMSRIKW